MTPEQFEEQMAWLSDLYPAFADVPAAMLVKWYAKLAPFDADLLHTAIDLYAEDETYKSPSQKVLLESVERLHRMRQQQRAAEAYKQWQKDQEKRPVEERAADLTMGMRQLLVHCWPEYRHLWPEVAAVEAEA